MPSIISRGGAPKITVFRTEMVALDKVIELCNFLDRNDLAPESAGTLLAQLEEFRRAIQPYVAVYRRKPNHEQV